MEVKLKKNRQVKEKTALQKRLKYIRKYQMPKHVIEIELTMSENDKRRILATSDELRIIRNTLLGCVYKNYKQMIRTKEYKALIIELRNLNKKINLDSISKENKKTLEAKRDSILKGLEELRNVHNITFEYIKNCGTRLKTRYNKPDAVLILSTCETVWKSMERIMFSNASRPTFYKKGRYPSLQGKQISKCVILKTDIKTNSFYIAYEKRRLDLKIKKDDIFILETLAGIKNYMENASEVDAKLASEYENGTIINTFRPCTNRIVIKEVRDKIRFYVQITLEGLPAVKRNKDGSFRHKLGTGKIGGDIGTQSLACCTENEAILKNLAERSVYSTFKRERKTTKTQRYMDRSRRATNPGNYNKDGTIKKRRSKWVKSVRSKKAQAKLKDLHRKTKVATKNKNGKFNRRKRFGKSILNRSPGYLIAQAKYRFGVTGGSVHEVNTYSFKASQYDHKLDGCNKKALSKRWHTFEDKTKVQRDLYSAFLLLCSNEELTSPVKETCDKLYNNFYKNHNECVDNIIKNRLKIMNSGIKIPA